MLKSIPQKTYTSISNFILITPQGLVTIHVNIPSMYKHVQGRTPFLPPIASSRVFFFLFLLIYSPLCLVQLPRPYSFKKYHDIPSNTSCEDAAVVLSGIRLRTQFHRHKAKVTAPPIKQTEVRNSRGFSFEVRKIPLIFKQTLNERDNMNMLT